MRLVLLSGIAWLVGLTQPVFDLGLTGPVGAHGEPQFETQFSWRDLILIAGGLFLLWKATNEIHHNVDPHPNDDVFDTAKAASSFGSAIVQIILLDLVFSIDSILTAVGMTDHLPIMVAAVLVAVTVMLLAVNPLANFINNNPTVVMLALGFLLMIGAVLIADGFGVPRSQGLYLRGDGLRGAGRGPLTCWRASAARPRMAEGEEYAHSFPAVAAGGRAGGLRIRA